MHCRSSTAASLRLSNSLNANALGVIAAILMASSLIEGARGDTEIKKPKCSEQELAAVKPHMEALMADTCVQEARDDQNAFLAATTIGCFLISLTLCLVLLSCIAYALLRKHGCVNRCTACICVLISVGIATVAMLLPVAVQVVGWVLFFKAVCDCQNQDNGCLTEKTMECWKENSDMTDQDDGGLLALPIAFGIIVIVLSIVLCFVTRKSDRVDTAIEETVTVSPGPGPVNTVKKV